MQRREFLALASGLLLSGTSLARSQQTGLIQIGLLSSRSLKESEKVLAAFRAGLSEQDYVEGRSLSIEYRWADGAYEALPNLAADLVRRKVSAIFAAGGEPSALAAQAVTSTIPIVFTSGSDPIKSGLVSTLNRPGANITGISFLVHDLSAKRLGLLRDLLPQSKSISFLINPQNRGSGAEAVQLRIVAAETGRDVDVVHANSKIALEKAFVDLSNQKVEALLIGNDPYSVVSQR